MLKKPIKEKIEKSLTKKFFEDWESCRERHSGQKQIIHSVTQQDNQYVFVMAGRKFSKTTCGIDIAWIKANESPNRVIYFCYPTIALGIEVVWEERRLQTCDRKDTNLQEKYVDKVDDSRHIVHFSNGSFVKLIGTWTESRGRGTQPDCIIYDEFQDANPDFVEAMDSNLAAKENAQCVILGTPPKKRNHFESWMERISNHPRGKVFHFTSYENDRLPHLKHWLDSKHTELLKANKEDVWLREYMAQLCYASSDRILPDAKILEEQEIYKLAQHFSYSERIPILAISVHASYFCAILAVYIKNKMLFIFDQMTILQVWNRSIDEMYPLLGEKVKKVQDFCAKKLRQTVWDESKSFVDIIPGFTPCRKDVKWQERGFPLLREMMVKEKIHFSRDVADFGLECQNLLLDENEKEVQKNYPRSCTLAMIANEYFSLEAPTRPLFKQFDKFEAFREMGIPYTKPKRRKVF